MLELVKEEDEQQINENEKEIGKKINNIDIDDIIRDTNIRIKEKIENISVDIARSIPNGMIGVYVFWLKSGDAYIGMSEGWGGIRSRIHSHTREGWQRKIIERFNIYVTETIGQALDLERMMIHKLNPELNSGCYLDMNNSVLLDRIEEIENNYCNYRLGNVIITYKLGHELNRGEIIEGNIISINNRGETFVSCDVRVINSYTIELISDDINAERDCATTYRDLKRKGYKLIEKKCERLIRTDFMQCGHERKN